MKKALITGIGGFVGSHLVQLLKKNKIEIDGIVHPNHPKPNFKELAENIKLIACDLLQSTALQEKLKGTRYDYIFHLAAYSSPAQSFKNPQQTLENNIFSQLNLLEQLAKTGSRAKILIVCSSEEYGNVEAKYLPISESTPLHPASPYAISKVAQDFLGLQYFLNHRLKIVRVRPFNHIGPGQSTNFVVPAFAAQIAKIEEKGGTINVGNLNSYRDFTDVRDIVRAYLLALEKGKIGEVYNIGSGKKYKIGDILKKLISFSKVPVKVSVNKNLLRSGEINEICCDFTKFKKQTGWMPKIPIEKSLFDTIEYERKKLKFKISN